MQDNKNPYGYDIVDEIPTASGKYLSFRKGDKGKTIQVRIASEPRYILQHWVYGNDGKQTPINCKGKDCPYCGESVPPKEKLQKVAKWGWIVIDRQDEMVKVFTGPTLIARSVKEISELVNMKTKAVLWGSPLLFDIQITRTEEPGASYYKVTPIGPVGEMDEEEKQKVKDAGYDLATELEGSQKSEDTGKYPAKDLETAPDEEIQVPDDLGEEAEEDKIPF